MGPKQRVCKICNKSYANGKALGGHMRSHLAKHPLPLPPKPKLNPNPNPNKPRSSVSTTKTSKELYVVEDIIMESEGEGESRQGQVPTTRRRSKRRRRSSETFTAEDAALFLIKLSKDRWDTKRQVVGDSNKELANRFKCETCNKVFGSYRALVGHKASHKKMMKAEISDDEDEDEDEDESTDEEDSNNEGANHNYVDDHHHHPVRAFQCPFCFKVFGSGQALGGHKKVHYSNILPVRARISSGKFENRLIIDLNVPAVADEEVG